MTIQRRLSLLIKALRLNNNTFAAKLEVNPSVTFNVIEGRKSNPSYELLEKIAFTFVNVNLYWLLKGEGEILLPESTQQGGVDVQTDATGSPESPERRIARLSTEEKVALITVQQDFIDQLKQQLEQANTLSHDLSKMLEKEIIGRP